jgi:chitodextrinase
MTRTFRRLSVTLAAGIFIFATAASAAAAAGDRFIGTLVAFHGDDLRLGRATTHGLALQTVTGRYELSFPGQSPQLGGGPERLAGKRVEVSGFRSGHTIAVGSIQVAAGGTGSTSTTSSAVAAATAKSVAVLLFNFQNDASQPYTRAFASGVMFSNANSVANYFGEESYGQLAVTGDVFGWYTVPFSNATCDFGSWATAVQSAAAAAGVTLANYTNIVYASPYASSCGWSGLAFLPGSESWNNGYMNLATNAHELSHNFGVHHASTLSCTVNGVRVALSANQSDCSLSEYGDPFSVMGSGSSRESHSEAKAQMGFIPSADRLDVTASGTYSVGVNEVSASTPKVLRIARTGAANQYFYLEFRQPAGTYFDNFNASDPVVQGITIRIAQDYPNLVQSWLVDTTPATSTFNDAALAFGGTFTDPLSGVSITTRSVSSTGASVAISFGADLQAPTAVTGLAATSTSMSSIGLSWSASTDNVGVAGYRVSRNGIQVATVSGTAWSDSGLAAATRYTYAVVAFDAAGNLSTAVSATGTTMADSQPPTAPGGLTATATSSTSVALGWSASTDNVGVAGYRVSRNGTLVATTTGRTWTDSAAAAATSYTYSVVAFDTVGNVSMAATATATTPGTAVQLSTPTLTTSASKRGGTALSWTVSKLGSTSATASGYRIYRNGALYTTTTGTTYKLSGQKGTWTFYVVAYDAAGDLSAPSNSVTVQT